MPAVFAARRLDMPVVVVSYDRTPGRASRLAARSRRSVRRGLRGVAAPARRTDRCSGSPGRSSTSIGPAPDGRAARAALGIARRSVPVAVMGGSLGSGVLNGAIADYLQCPSGRSIARCSPGGGRTIRSRASRRWAMATRGVLHQVIAYEPDMAAVYAGCDLLIGRGGASTVHEVAVTGTPAILVPWADSADDHQTDNVRWLSEVGGAVLLPESDLGRLGEEIDALRGDPSRCSELSAAARRPRRDQPFRCIGQTDRTRRRNISSIVTPLVSARSARSARSSPFDSVPRRGCRAPRRTAGSSWLRPDPAARSRRSRIGSTSSASAARA